eukprot:SAG11_NODE_23108_length_394_cov_147.376271_1_plen_131_part_11
MMCPIEQYRPDGWLGMLIGTRMWYPLYGEAESDASVFEERMVALCRDLGERGQRGAVTEEAGGEAGSAPGSSEHSAEAKSAVLGTLRELKVSELKRRAMACGVSEEEIEGACDEDDARAALAELIVAGEAG